MLNELTHIMRLLDRFVGNYPIFLYLLDDENRVVWTNQFLKDKVPELQRSRRIDPDSPWWPATDHANEESASAENAVEKRLTMCKIDEQERQIEFLSLPLRGRFGQNSGALRLGVDVTENEEARRRLREKEKLFSAIIRSSPDAVIFLDNDERVVSWNRGANDIFGYSREEMVHQSIDRLIPEDLQNLGEKEYMRKELEEKGAIRKYETQRLHKDGHSIYVDISSTQIVDENGEVGGTSQIIKNIDSRKELEFELLRTILELSKLNDLNEILHSTYEEEEILRIILVAITAGEGLRFNRAFLVMIDHETQRLQGTIAVGPSNEDEANRIWSELDQQHRYLKDIVRAYSIDVEGSDRQVNQIVQQINIPLSDEKHVLVEAVRKHQVLQIEKRQLLHSSALHCEMGDGHIFDLFASDKLVIAPMFSRTESLGLIIADNCISRQKVTPEDIEGLKLFATQASLAIENARLYEKLERRVEEVQDAYEQLEENQERLLRAERLATIGEMSAKIAHEIRNPLVSIGGFARLIERKIEEDNQLKQYAGIIRDQVSNLEQILNNILNVANPPKPEKNRVDINQSIEQVVGFLANAFDERGIVSRLELSAEECIVLGDAKLLHQMFLNLLKNAIEALEGQELERRVTVETRINNAMAEIQVTDNGPGIETGVLKKIFQSFFTTKSSGSGLGLSIVKQIVKNHNGKVDVRTRKDEGASFVVQLPLAPQEEAVEETGEDGFSENHS